MSGALRLDLGALLAALDERAIEFVLAGSVAAMAYGVDLVPGDLDIVPSLEPANLRRLGTLLRELGAKPKHVPGWAEGPDREACERWQPEPFDAAALDHRFVTPWGELDVVPLKAGTFDELRPAAVAMKAFGRSIQVAHPDHLLAQFDHWARPRDRERRLAMLEARARFLAGAPLPALETHPAWRAVRSGPATSSRLPSRP